jgi:hypothetical protein
MTNPTSNFNWQMPTSTDLVTDLPADFEVFGQAVDTSLADLKGGTTGQVLAKASNADMDFVWSADAAGMTNPMTTTGDTIYSSSGSTPARLGIGTTGQVLTVAGGLPSWATATSGGMTLISTATPSGATTISFTSIPTTYKQLYLFWNLYHSSSTEYLYIRLNNDSGGNYSGRGLKVSNNVVGYDAYSGNSGFGDSNQLSPVDYSNGTTFNRPYKGFMTIERANEAVDHVVNFTTFGASSTGASYGFTATGIYTGTAAAVSRLDFIRSSTQTITGTVSLYGVN